MSQHLAMTPQLQQAIRLLQMSTLELQVEIQQTLDSNVMLEALDDSAEVTDEPLNGTEASAGDDTYSAEVLSEAVGGVDSENEDGDLHSLPTEIPEELPVDSGWEDVYDGMPATQQAGDYQGRDNLDSNGNAGESLQEHLLWQMRLTPFSETDQIIATTVIDAINEDGYLDGSIEDIHQALCAEFDITPEEIEAVLHRIQHFDPVGVGARDVRECLLIQLRQSETASPYNVKAQELVSAHLDLLAERNYTQLMRSLHVDEGELDHIVRLIQGLQPRPGVQVERNDVAHVVPDIIVKKRNGRWRVELNMETAPALRINPRYAGLVRRADSSADNVTLKNHLQEARWFIKSLQSRNETLLKVATCIVERQRSFLERGEQAMQPMILRDIAEVVEMHESTISRITTQKYMHTPRGIFEFRYFFSSHVNMTGGGECSATAIRAKIKQLIAKELPLNPLSDRKIATLLLHEGIEVARRTVAKYRESLGLHSSGERKRLAKMPGKGVGRA